jgi:hypothetical protein
VLAGLVPQARAQAGLPVAQGAGLAAPAQLALGVDSQVVAEEVQRAWARRAPAMTTRALQAEARQAQQQAPAVRQQAPAVRQRVPAVRQQAPVVRQQVQVARAPVAAVAA